MPLWCGKGQCYCEHVLLKLFQAQILIIFITECVSECLLFLVFVTINNTSMLRCCTINVPVVIASVVIFKTLNKLINSLCYDVSLFAVLTFAPKNL